MNAPTTLEAAQADFAARARAYEETPNLETLRALREAEALRADLGRVGEAEATQKATAAAAAMRAEAEARLASLPSQRPPAFTEEDLQAMAAIGVAFAHVVRRYAAAFATNVALDAAEIHDRRFLDGPKHVHAPAELMVHNRRVEAARDTRTTEAMTALVRAFRGGLEAAEVDAGFERQLLTALHHSPSNPHHAATAEDVARAKPGPLGRWMPRWLSAITSAVRAT